MPAGPRRPLWLALCAALAVRVLVLVRLPAPPAWDGTLYARLTAHLLAGLGYSDFAWQGGPMRHTAFYPVGYSAALAPFVAALGELRGVHALNLVCALLACAAATLLGHRAAGTRGAYIAGLSYALAPGPTLFCTAAMTETLAGALLALAVLASLGAPGASTARRSVLAGLALGAAALVRPQWLLAAPFVGALPPANRRARVLGGALCLLAACAVVAPWTARNCVRLGRCALVSTNGGPNLLLGTLPETGGGWRPLRPSDGCADAAGEVARDRCLSSLAARRIAAAPGTWVRLAFVKLGRTFAREWAPVSYVRSALPGALGGTRGWLYAGACMVSWWAVALAAMVGGARIHRHSPWGRALARTVLLEVLLCAFTHALFIGDDRYHLPLWPLLCVLAAGCALPGRSSPADPEFALAS